MHLRTRVRPQTTNTKNKQKPKPEASGSRSKGRQSDLSNAALAKRFDRCGKCGLYVANPTERAAHVASCRGQTDRAGKDVFNTRMGQVRALVKSNKVVEVNTFTIRGPPGPPK